MHRVQRFRQCLALLSLASLGLFGFQGVAAQQKTDTHLEPLEQPLNVEQQFMHVRELVLFDTAIKPNTAHTFFWGPGSVHQNFDLKTPVFVRRGAHDGPTVCLVSTLHGDEINGIEVIRELFEHIDLDKLYGSVVGVPVVNMDGFRRDSRYMTSRQDLNRYFPGKEFGNTAERFAHRFFSDIITHCDFLVDLHTGSLHRENLPQVRANLKLKTLQDLVDGLSELVIVHSEGSKGMLRVAAIDEGIPAVTLEIGGPHVFDRQGIDAGVSSIRSLLRHLKMLRDVAFLPKVQAGLNESKWVRVNDSGLFFSTIKLGDTVDEGDEVGYVSDPINLTKKPVIATFGGLIIGLARDQVVHEGFAVVHIAHEVDVERIEKLPPQQSKQGDG